MSITIPTAYTRGNRVRVLGGFGIPDQIIGQTAVVVGTYDINEPFVVMDDPNMPTYGGRNDGSWVIREWERIDPTIGDTVTAVDVPGREDYNGKTAKVTDIQSDGCILGEFQSIQKPDDTEMFGFYEWKPIEYVPLVGETVRMTGYLAIDGIRTTNGWFGTVTEVNNGVWTVTVEGTNYPSGPGYVFPITDGQTLTVSNAVVETDVVEEPMVPKRELDRANERVEEYAARAGKWERDFSRYATRILQEAVDRGWCEQYEGVMRDIQDDLEIAEIPEREQEFEVEIEMEGTCRVTRTVTVTAKSLDDAIEMVNDDMDSYVNVEEALTEGARWNGWDNTEVTSVSEA